MIPGKYTSAGPSPGSVLEITFSPDVRYCVAPTVTDISFEVREVFRWFRRDDFQLDDGS